MLDLWCILVYSSMKFPFLKKSKLAPVSPLVKKTDIDPLHHWKQILLVTLIVTILVIGASFLLSYLANESLLVDSESQAKIEALKPLEFKEDQLHTVVHTFHSRDSIRRSIINPTKAEDSIIINN